jgi:SRSO17 transposase
VIDESGDEKSGSHSCGAASQWFGRQGKKANCQMGVFLLGVAAAGTALLDHQLFLPADWAKDKARRKKTHVPDEIEFQTKPELACELLRRTRAAGHVKFDWITADELYGRSAKFLDVLDELSLRYVVEVPVNTTFYIRDPAVEPGAAGPKSKSVRALLRNAKQLAASLPADAWQPILLREGTKGPLVAEFARLRVWAVRQKKPHYAVWLMFRRDLETEEMHYFVSHADEAVSLEEMALVSAARIKVEEYFEDGKGHLGFADHEARGWDSWHHHMSMVALAHLYVVLARHQLKASLPQLTLDRTVALMQAALDRPQLTIEDAQRLLEYHLHHNAVAHRSHRKSWLLGHKEIALKLLL